MPDIRHATPAEAAPVADLWLRFQREHNGRYVRQVRQTRANRDCIAAHYEKLAGQRQLWVVEADGALVGFAAVVPNLPKVDLYYASAAITDLWVEPAWRGHGLGRALIDRVVGEVAERGLHAVTLTVMAGNPARELYREAGFQPFSESMILPLVPGMVRTGPGYPEA